MNQNNKILYHYQNLFLLVALIFLNPAYSQVINVLQSCATPLCFTENKGQWHDRVLYKSDSESGFTWWFERNGLTLDISVPDSTANPITNKPSGIDGQDEVNQLRYPVKRHILKMRFVAKKTQNAEYSFSCKGSDSYQPALPAEVIPAEPLSWNSNYFLGNDPGRWAPDCRNFTRLTYNVVWDGIDVVYYGQGRQLKYDIIVNPGSDPSEIRLRWLGLEEPLTLDKDSAVLNLATSVGTLHEAPPSAWQTSDAGYRIPVDVRFVVRSGNEYGFNLGNFDPDRPLIIDPLVYSTYLGGGEDDEANAICCDGEDGIVVAGLTEGQDFPTTEGAFQPNHIERDYSEAFIARINSQGNQLIYCTYLGGTRDDLANAVCSDNEGGVLIAGETRSRNFPVTDDAFQTVYYTPSADAFITHLNAQGNDLIFSTYLGGNGSDHIFAICRDAEDGIIIAGKTSSNRFFPISEDAFQRSPAGGGSDCFVSRFNSQGSELIFSTYLGGDGRESAYALLPDAEGGVVVAGCTYADNFPTTQRAFQRNSGGEMDAFITHLNSQGSHLIYSTFLGGHTEDRIYSLISDGEDGVIAAGWTRSNDFPVTEGAYQENYGREIDAFISHLDSEGSNLNYSTYLGGNDNDFAFALTSDGLGGVVVGGGTCSENFPITEDAFQRNFGGGSRDAFITHFNFLDNPIIYSTYFGSSNRDQIYNLIRDGEGAFVAAGYTESRDFHVSDGCIDCEYNGGRDIFVAKFQFFINWIDFPQEFHLMERQDINVLLEGTSVNEDVELTIVYNSENLPDNVVFIDLGDGFAEFYWEPDIGDAGEYSASFTLSDGVNELPATSRIFVDAFPLGWVQLPDTVEAAASDTLMFTLGSQSINEDDRLSIIADARTIPGNARLTDFGDGTAEFLWIPSFEDVGIIRVRFILSNGEHSLPGLVTIIIHEPDYADANTALPKDLVLQEVHPNPFNSTATISYALPVASLIRLQVFNIEGKLMQTLFDGHCQAGLHSQTINGVIFPSGVYLLSLDNAEQVLTQKVVLIR